MKFIVVLHTNDGQRFGTTVPDLPGCFSGGDSLDDALDSLREAVDLHVQTAIEDGAAIPAATPLRAHQANPDYAGGVWAVVEVSDDYSDFRPGTCLPCMSSCRYLAMLIDQRHDFQLNWPRLGFW